MSDTKIIPIFQGLNVSQKPVAKKPPVWEYTEEELAELPPNVRAAVKMREQEEKLGDHFVSEGDFGGSKHISARDRKK